MSLWRVPDETLSALGERIVARADGAAFDPRVAFGELTIHADASRIVGLLSLLRDDPEFQFQQLIDLCGADYPQRQKRFDVVYHLLSLTQNRRVRVKVETDEETPAPSVTSRPTAPNDS